MGVGAGLYMCDIVKKFTFAISSPDEFLSRYPFVCQRNKLEQLWTVFRDILRSRSSDVAQLQ